MELASVVVNSVLGVLTLWMAWTAHRATTVASDALGLERQRDNQHEERHARAVTVMAEPEDGDKAVGIDVFNGGESAISYLYLVHVDEHGDRTRLAGLIDRALAPKSSPRYGPSIPLHRPYESTQLHRFGLEFMDCAGGHWVRWHDGGCDSVRPATEDQ